MTCSGKLFQIRVLLIKKTTDDRELKSLQRERLVEKSDGAIGLDEDEEGKWYDGTTSENFGTHYGFLFPLLLLKGT